jgi:hypothetical protein
MVTARCFAYEVFISFVMAALEVLFFVAFRHMFTF